MSKQGIEQHLQQYKDLNVFVLLDGASIPDLLNHLYVENAPAFECLYEGELEPDMAEVAPYLVKLGQSAMFDAWVYEGWGLNWGIYAITPTTTDLGQLRRHFRKLNKVYSPNNQPLYFRYYDPYTLQIFLPTCDEVQLKAMFGPVAMFIAEVYERPAYAYSFSLENNELLTKKLAISQTKDAPRHQQY